MKIGDKVKISHDLKIGEHSSEYVVLGEMLKYRGFTVTIIEIFSCDSYHDLTGQRVNCYRFAEIPYTWGEKWFDNRKLKLDRLLK